VDRRLCIAVDGPASSGKGTVARLVAKKLGYSYIDTGAMYRSVAFFAHQQGIEWGDAKALARMVENLQFDFTWNGEELDVIVDGRNITQNIRREQIGNGASVVGTHPEVRLALLERQRDFAQKGGVVMDGRDIGTVVLPDADLKIFLDASASERARRRHAELQGKGSSEDFETVLAGVNSRDEQDRNRTEAPLRQASDAVYIDTTGMSANEAALTILKIAADLA